MRKFINIISLLAIIIVSSCKKEDDLIPVAKITFKESYISDFKAISLNCEVKSNVTIETLHIEYSATKEMESSNKVELHLVKDNLYSAEISGLEIETEYYYRYIVGNKVSEFFDDQKRSFKTLDYTSPVVLTGDALDISGTKATLNGTIEFACDKPILEKGFMIGRSEKELKEYKVEGEQLIFNVNDLDYKTIYYYRAYAKNEIGVGLGEIKTFETCSAVSFKELEVHSITATSAIVEGGISDNGDIEVEIQGLRYAIKGTDNVSFIETTTTASLSALQHDTTYEIWGYAKTFEGEFEGKPVEFKTLDGIVLISTSSPTDITKSSAVLKGCITSDGGSKIIERGFCYSTDNTPTINSTKLKVDGETGEYTTSVNNLPQNVKYNVRSYAINGIGTYYGEVVSFTTLYDSATFGTITSSDITASSISVSCAITSNGGSNITKCGFCYSTYRNPTIDDEIAEVSDSKTKLNTTIKGLKSGVTYYVRAFATNANSTFYSDEISFVTCEGVIQFSDPETSNIAAASIIVSSNVLSAGGGTISERGFCYNTSKNPTIENTIVKTSGTIGEYSTTLSNLQNKTIYYIRAYAVNESGTYYSKEITVKTLDGIATLTTADVTNIKAQSATLKGEIVSDGGSNITERGFCYSTEESPTTESKIVTIEGAIGEITCNISELTNSTTYYVRTYAKNGYGTHYGNQNTFTTSSGVVEFAEIVTSEITVSDVTITSKVTTDGNSTITQRGFCYSENTNPSLSDSKITITGTTGNMTCNINGLTNGKKYYVRAFATNAINTYYSTQISFITLTGLADVTTSDATNVMAESATFNGNVVSANGGDITSRGFCYSLSPSPTVNDNKLTVSGSTGNMSTKANNLTKNTTYYVRSYATTSFGTTYGEEKSFITKDGVISFNSINSSNVLATTANLYSVISTNGGSEITEKGFCYSTSPTPTVNNKKIINNENANNFTSTISNLECSTTYYVRAYAINNIDIYYSDDISFTTDTGIASVDLLSVDNIRQTTVDASCSITGDGGAEIVSRGFCYSTTPNPTTNSNKIIIEGTVGAIQGTITNLISDQDYYIKAFAQTKHQTTYSNEVSIHTIEGLGTTTDVNIISIQETQATLSANLISMGGTTVTTLGYCYSTKTSPTISDNTITVTAKLGTFTVEILNLEQHTTYYARPYSITEYGVSYGEEISFKTKYYPVTFGEITATPYPMSADIKCPISSDGGNAITEHGICYSDSSNPTINNNKITLSEENSTLIGRLESGKKYYARRYATNRIATFYSEQVEFTTVIVPDGAIPGLFSISETEKIFFAKGNLILEDEVFKFAENQYDYHGYYTVANSETLKNPRDFFHPKNDYDAITNANISNVTSDEWELLTRAEWGYILNTRNIPSYSIYIDGIKIQGRLILPDGWISPEITTALSNESQNIISIEEFNILQSAGAAFMPSAGYSMYHEYSSNKYRHYIKDLGFSSCHYFVKDPSYSYTYYRGIPDAISSAYVYDVADKYGYWIDVHYNRANGTGVTSYLSAVRLVKRSK